MVWYFSGHAKVPVADCTGCYFSTHPKTEMTFTEYLQYWQSFEYALASQNQSRSHNLSQCNKSNDHNSPTLEAISSSPCDSCCDSNVAVAKKLLYLKDWHFFQWAKVNSIAFLHCVLMNITIYTYLYLSGNFLSKMGLAILFTLSCVVIGWMKCGVVDRMWQMTISLCTWDLLEHGVWFSLKNCTSYEVVIIMVCTSPPPPQDALSCWCTAVSQRVPCSSQSPAKQRCINE